MHNLVNILKSPLYPLLTVGVGFIVFASTVLLPNRTLLLSLWTDSTVSLGDKLAVPISILGSIATNFSPLSATYTVGIAALVGINVSLITYLLRNGGIIWTGSSAGVAGIFSGILGIGCAACGSLVLMAILGTTLGASIIAVLPLKGGEFGILGVILLGTATYLLAQQITKPLVCEVTNVNV